MRSKYYYRYDNQSRRRGKYRIMAAVFIAMAIFIMARLSYAAYAAAADKTPKYQVIAANDRAYLLDTTTGVTWILTYRTIATGREPIAIPLKFIKISPANQKDFIVETNQGVSLLPNAVQ